jgi:thiol-disulfide isomerase/thioredoxin
MSSDKPKPIHLTLYHAKWCSHCVKFMPIWDAMKSNPKIQKNIMFSTIEDTEINNMSESKRPTLEGFPTIKYTINGKTYTYDNERTENAILQTIINNIKGKHQSATTDEHTISPMSGGMNSIYTATMNDMVRKSTKSQNNIFSPVSSQKPPKKNTESEMDGGMNSIYTATVNDMIRNSTKSQNNIFSPVSSQKPPQNNPASNTNVNNILSTHSPVTGTKYAPRINIKL